MYNPVTCTTGSYIIFRRCDCRAHTSTNTAGNLWYCTSLYPADDRTNEKRTPARMSPNTAGDKSE